MIRNLPRHRHLVVAMRARAAIRVRLDLETCHWPLFIFCLSHSLASLVLLDRWSTMIMSNKIVHFMVVGGGGVVRCGRMRLHSLCRVRQRFFPPFLVLTPT